MTFKTVTVVDIIIFVIFISMNKFLLGKDFTLERILQGALRQISKKKYWVMFIIHSNSKAFKQLLK